MKIPGELVRLKWFIRPFIINAYLKRNKEPKLHLGSGEHIIPGFLNGDKFMANADIYLDLYRHFPFKSNTFTKVYSEHLLEHINTNKVHLFLSEVYRVLKNDGIFRLTCPDFDIYAHNYVNQNNDFYNKVIDNLSGKRKRDPELTWILRSNAGCFVASILKDYHNHKWMYDFSTIESCLKEVGFREVTKRDYGKSLDRELGALDLEMRKFETLYVDAIK